jgi:N-methylhydantoinase A
MTRVIRSDRATDAELREGLERIAREAVDELGTESDIRDPVLTLTVSCRYLGQNYEQDVPVTLEADDLVRFTVERFHEAHERTYGYRIAEGVVELVYFTAVAVQRQEAPPALALPELDKPRPVATRPVYFKELGWVETPIYRREHLGRGIELAGPLVVEEVDSTTLVLHGQVARTHPTGSLLIAEADAISRNDLAPAELEVAGA